MKEKSQGKIFFEDDRRLPEGWRLVHLGEICKFVNGDAYKETDWNLSGVPIIRIQNLNSREKKFNYWAGSLDGRVVVNDGDVLLAWSGTPGTSFGAHIWDRGIGVLNQHIFRVDINANFLYPFWAVHAINQKLDILIRKAHGGVGLRHVTRKEVEDLEIPLPPLPEQKRIAAILKEQMEVVERARAAAEVQLEAAQALSAAYLREVFESEKSKKWPQKNLIDLCEFPGQYGTSEKAIGDVEDVPVIRMGNIVDGKIVWDNLKYMRFINGAEKRRYLLSKGDIVFNRTNSVELVGKCAVFEEEREAVFASYLIRFRIKASVGDPYFLAMFINSKYGRSYIETNMARAVGQANISASTMHKMLIPVPPLKVQKVIVDELLSIDESIGCIKNGVLSQISIMNRLPSAFLRQAFSGEI